MVGKPYALCKWQKDQRGTVKGEYMKIVKFPKNVSQRREEIIETINEYFVDKGVLKPGQSIDQDSLIKEYINDSEDALYFLIHIEKSWHIDFGEEAAMIFAKQVAVGTFSDFISIVIKVMNR